MKPNHGHKKLLRECSCPSPSIHSSHSAAVAQLAHRLKKRNEDHLNEKLALNLTREMQVKAVRDKTLKEKRTHTETMSRTRKAIEESRRKEVRKEETRPLADHSPSLPSPPPPLGHRDDEAREDECQCQCTN
jgi:hypothetical protein